LTKETDILDKTLAEKTMSLFQDARDYQILFLSGFLFLGISTRDWTLRADLMAVVIVSCLVTQFVFLLLMKAVKTEPQVGVSSENFLSSLYHLSLSSFRSAAITALGLCLLLRANDYHTMALAGCLAIASKFVFQLRGKHFFNPANFGIIMALIFSHDAWISPGQWGTDWLYLLLFVGTAGIVLKQVGRWDTSATFLLTYAGLLTLRNCWLGWSFDVLGHQLMSGSLLLFAFFMITDPRSIPNGTKGRLIWSVCIAILTFVLQYQFYISTAVFWALFALSPLTIVLDNIWVAPRFNWQFSMARNSESEVSI
jgi:Na+-transporting NADH:ubiquinone oxidoreductase subunit NqrB